MRYLLQLYLVIFLSVIMFSCVSEIENSTDVESNTSQIPASLRWDPVLDSDLSSYRIYHGLVSNDYIDVIELSKDNSSYALSTLDPRAMHYFSVTAIDSSGNESPYSQEVVLTPQDLEAQSNVNASMISAGESASIELLTPTQKGGGTYFDPYILNTDQVSWKIHIGANDGTTKYNVEVHEHIGRSCNKKYYKDGMSYSDANNSIHYFGASKSALMGAYYIGVFWLVNGVEQGHQKVWVHFRVPTFKDEVIGDSSKLLTCQQMPNKAASDLSSADDYYYQWRNQCQYDGGPTVPPASNQAPTPKVRFINAISGSGSYNNPYKLCGNTVQFCVNNTTDPNGSNDLRYGAWHWDIITKGHHPVYNKIEAAPHTFMTYAFYNEINELQTWDTTERPSQDDRGLYYLTLYVMDRYGEPNRTEQIHFIADPLTKAPAVASNICTNANYKIEKCLALNEDPGITPPGGDITPPDDEIIPPDPTVDQIAPQIPTNVVVVKRKVSK